MFPPRQAKVWASQALFADAPARARLHVAARRLSAPLGAVVGSVPPNGRTLDFGCGHGLISLTLGLRDPTCDVEGVDVDEHKIGCAQQAAIRGGFGERVRFSTITPNWKPQRATYDTVVVCDVLYLLGHQAARPMVRDLGAAVRAGGRLIIKEMSEVPRWKNQLDHAQEHLAVRTLGYTVGDRIEPFGIEHIAHQLRSDGWSASIQRLDRRYPHPHALVIGISPAGQEK